MSPDCSLLTCFVFLSAYAGVGSVTGEIYENEEKKLSHLIYNTCTSYSNNNTYSHCILIELFTIFTLTFYIDISNDGYK